MIFRVLVGNSLAFKVKQTTRKAPSKVRRRTSSEHVTEIHTLYMKLTIWMHSQKQTRVGLLLNVELLNIVEVSCSCHREVEIWKSEVEGQQTSLINGYCELLNN